MEIIYDKEDIQYFLEKINSNLKVKDVYEDIDIYLNDVFINENNGIKNKIHKAVLKKLKELEKIYQD